MKWLLVGFFYSSNINSSFFTFLDYSRYTGSATPGFEHACTSDSYLTTLLVSENTHGRIIR